MRTHVENVTVLNLQSKKGPPTRQEPNTKATLAGVRDSAAVLRRPADLRHRTLLSIVCNRRL